MELPDVFTQAELDDALARGDTVPVCAGDGEFTVAGDVLVRAADYATVTARDRAVVDAVGEATVRAVDSATVLARGRVTVNASGAACVRAGDQSLVYAWDAADVVASRYAIVHAADRARVAARANVTVNARDSVVVRARNRVRVRAAGDAEVHVWGHASVQAWERVRVDAWGEAMVQAAGEVSVEAREQCTVHAGGHSRVRAFGSAVVRARARATVVAGEYVHVTCEGGEPEIAAAGVTRVRRPQDAREWCDFYGVEVRDGTAILYKAVGDDFSSYYGLSYRPGTEPHAPDWEGGDGEWGRGLHLSPRPALALPRTYGASRFVACPVRLEDIVVHRGGAYPDVVTVARVCAPVYEVDEQGRPVGDGA